MSENHSIEENAGSDSDSNSVVFDDYQPISASESDADSEKQEDNGDLSPDTSEFFPSLPFQNPNSQNFPNGFHNAENGISALDLNAHTQNNVVVVVDDDDEERLRQVSESAISRAFREDESRRNAPLSMENSSRIIDAMRGISFPGFRPDWADHVPEDLWVDQIRRSREPTSQN
ncbi:uncharacterized protein LOC143849077 isoform X1 [Tasmannia lanceolata]|uniref:uncharacterized protein LOC143849077 isoform X1 n=1 Tax=Tasmannia lanceolata TaxID=3420 RepID=UPI0040628D2F